MDLGITKSIFYSMILNETGTCPYVRLVVRTQPVLPHPSARPSGRFADKGCPLSQHYKTVKDTRRPSPAKIRKSVDSCTSA